MHGRLPLDSSTRIFEWNKGVRTKALQNVESSKRGQQYSIDFKLLNDFTSDTTFYLRNCDNGISEMRILDSTGHIQTTEKTGYYTNINERYGHDEQGFMPVPLKAGALATVQLLITSYNGNKADITAAIYSTEAYYKFYKDNTTTASTQEYITIFFIGAIFMMLVFFLVYVH